MNEDYSQPCFYKFNSDSFDLIDYVLKNIPTVHAILDLGAGCGVIGIEIAKRSSARHLTLVELQTEYKNYIEDNCKKFLRDETQVEIAISSFQDYQSVKKFDLIVCNPPYYLPGHGELPKIPQRALARTFLVDDWMILVRKIAQSLTVDGSALIVLKNDENLIKEIAKIALGNDLVLERISLTNVVILKLFRLNKK
jgi:tRNA1(Val) A37 N6-methylase TrmN6